MAPSERGETIRSPRTPSGGRLGHKYQILPLGSTDESILSPSESTMHAYL